TWIAGARMTPAANSSLIVNMMPVVMPLLLWMTVRERVSRNEWIGTVVTILGMFVLGVSDLNLSAEYFQGDLICFGSMLCMALYLVLAKRNAHFPSLWLYLVPLYTAGGIFCLLIGLVTNTGSFGFSEMSAQDVTMIGLLALIPTVGGHSIFNFAMKRLRGQLVSLLCLTQFIFAAIMAVFLLSPPEFPAWTFYPASGLVVLGAIIALRGSSPV
ncbi:MAG: DMT family transporter, partial [Planctomycetes bacterium]|nr:DMT family transporter [Planctomycetota bacterium]